MNLWPMLPMSMEIENDANTGGGGRVYIYNARTIGEFLELQNLVVKFSENPIDITSAYIEDMF